MRINFSYVPSLLGLTLPFSIMLSNYLFALVMIILIFTSPRRKTIQWLAMLLMAIPVLIPLLSLMFHGQAFDVVQLEVRVPFLVTAVIFGIFVIDPDQMKGLKVGLVLGSILAATIVFIERNFLGENILASNWIDLSYIPMFLVTALIILWFTNIEIPKNYKIALTIVLCAAIVLLGPVFFVVSGLLVAISAIIVKGSKLQSKMAILILVVLGSLVLYKGVEINKFLSERNDFHATPKNKLAQWQCVLEVMTDQELFGIGYGEKKMALLDCYHAHEMTEAEASAFNAHNEYLDFFLTLGYIGVIGLLIYFINGFFVAYDNRQTALLLILIMLSLFALNENIFTRQKGVMLTSLVYFLIYANKDFFKKNQEISQPSKDDIEVV